MKLGMVQRGDEHLVQTTTNAKETCFARTLLKGHFVCCTLSLRLSLEPHARKCCVCFTQDGGVVAMRQSKQSHKTNASPSDYDITSNKNDGEITLSLSDLKANCCGSEDQTDYPSSPQCTMETIKNIQTMHPCTKQGGASVGLPSHHSLC